MNKVGNNGNELVDVLHNEGLLSNGMTAEEIEQIAIPFMLNKKHLKNDDFWEDVFYRADELGYALKY